MLSWRRQITGVWGYILLPLAVQDLNVSKNVSRGHIHDFSDGKDAMVSYTRVHLY